MHEFKYRDNELYCEDVPVAKIAGEVGTPFYLYSLKTLRNHYRVFESSFSEIPHIISFAVKANSNLAILNILAREGCGADIASGGELYRALEAGIDPRKIVYAGVGKTKEEIRYALESDILFFNVESTQELKAIDDVAGSLGRKARVSLRVNPDIDPRTHPYISTGLKKHKFGIGIERAMDEYKAASLLKNIDLAGVHYHIGSQMTEIDPFLDALKGILSLVTGLKRSGIDIRYIDVGGGLGITYNDEEPPHPKDLADAIMPLIKDLGCEVILEPGRIIAGNAGILVSKVLYVKEGEGKRFIIVDAGMNDLIRPSLYEAYHEILPVIKDERKKVVADIVGPICESSDFLAREREVNEFCPDELLAVMSAGAYGFTMSSNYNSRRRVPEVLVKGDRHYIIRTRERYEDLIRGEVVPDIL
ncbi:MAG TPA: diaminopimelate decarboxylase [Nitrospiria bacterium]|nr:diaminopimelate decarboxylase [Nitrospiria bacterium]